MKSKTLRSFFLAFIGLLVFFAVLILSGLYRGSDVPVQFAGALLGAIVTAVITMVLLHGQSQAEETKERNVKVFEEKTRRYNDFLTRLWDVWQDRHVTLEELNELMELVSKNIIVYTKEENTQKLLRSLTRIATHAGKPYTSTEEQKEVQREVFEIINILSDEIGLGGQINDAIRSDLNILEDKIRPILLEKECRKRLIDEVGTVINQAKLPVRLSQPPYCAEWVGNKYMWIKISDCPVELCIGPVSNLTGTGGYLIGFFADISILEFNKYRNGSRGFHAGFLKGVKWDYGQDHQIAEAVPDFNKPESVAAWLARYTGSVNESPGTKVGEMLVKFVQEWRLDGRQIDAIIDECCPKNDRPLEMIISPEAKL